jgi:hypothetical protein
LAQASSDTGASTITFSQYLINPFVTLTNGDLTVTLQPGASLTIDGTLPDGSQFGIFSDAATHATITLASANAFNFQNLILNGVSLNVSASGASLAVGSCRLTGENKDAGPPAISMQQGTSLLVDASTFDTLNCSLGSGAGIYGERPRPVGHTGGSCSKNRSKGKMALAILINPGFTTMKRAVCSCRPADTRAHAACCEL